MQSTRYVYSCNVILFKRWRQEEKSVHLQYRHNFYFLWYSLSTVDCIYGCHICDSEGATVLCKNSAALLRKEKERKKWEIQHFLCLFKRRELSWASLALISQDILASMKLYSKITKVRTISCESVQCDCSNHSVKKSTLFLPEQSSIQPRNTRQFNYIIIDSNWSSHRVLNSSSAP